MLQINLHFPTWFSDHTALVFVLHGTLLLVFYNLVKVFKCFLQKRCFLLQLRSAVQYHGSKGANEELSAFQRQAVPLFRFCVDKRRQAAAFSNEYPNDAK